MPAGMGFLHNTGSCFGNEHTCSCAALRSVDCCFFLSSGPACRIDTSCDSLRIRKPIRTCSCYCQVSKLRIQSNRCHSRTCSSKHCNEIHIVVHCSATCSASQNAKQWLAQLLCQATTTRTFSLQSIHTHIYPGEFTRFGMSTLLQQQLDIVEATMFLHGHCFHLQTESVPSPAAYPAL